MILSSPYLILYIIFDEGMLVLRRKRGFWISLLRGMRACVYIHLHRYTNSNGCGWEAHKNTI